MEGGMDCGGVMEREDCETPKLSSSTPIATSKEKSLPAESGGFLHDGLWIDASNVLQKSSGTI